MIEPLVDRLRVRAVQAAQSVSADQAAAILADADGFAAFAGVHELTGGISGAALRRALEVRSGRPTARVSPSRVAPRIGCVVCELEHPAVWREADRAWVAQPCDRDRITRDFDPPRQMSIAALKDAVGRLRRYAWAFQDFAGHDVEQMRRVLLALEQRERWLRVLIGALRGRVPDELLDGVAAEAWVDLSPRRVS